jgi:hypothetical protein
MARDRRFTVLLRGLAEAPDLRLRVLVGEDALDRPVDGVFTTDLLDPRRYLTGGEIVLTGLMWRRAPADSESFAAALTAAGAVALAAGDAALGSVPDDLVVACRRHGLPLFEVPVDVSFAAITEQVLAARLRPAGPGPAVARLRALAAGRGSAEHGSGEGAARLAEVFAVAGREYGAPGWVLSAAGRLVAGAPGAPGRRARTALAAAWLGAGAPPVTVVAGGVPYSLFGVTGEPAHRQSGWFVAMAGDQAGWDADQRAIAAELAAAAAAHRARDEEARRPARRAADAAIGRLLARPAGATGPEDLEIAASLRRCGLGPGGPLVAVAVTAGPAQPGAWLSPGADELTGGPAQSGAGVSLGTVELTGGDAQPGAGPSAGAVSPPGEMRPSGGTRPPVAGADPHQAAWPQVARVLLEEMLPGSVAGVAGGAAVAFAPGASAVLDRIRDVTRELAAVYGPGAPGDVAPASLCLAFGVSVLPGGAVAHGPQAGDGPAGPGGGAGSPEAGWTVAGLGRALDQARQARRIAALLGGGVRVVNAARLGSVELLLATAPAEARQAFRASLLSPLLDYDADHGTELVRTLRVFLDCSGSWTRAAGAMFVHVNSLRYRMRRVEELTGLDLGSLADQAALLLALRLADPGVLAREDDPPEPPGGLRPGSSVTGTGPA